MPFRIARFSAWLCLMYSTKKKSFLDAYALRQLAPVDVKRVKIIIHRLYKMYRNELNPIIEEIIDINRTECIEFFMRAIICKCLELSACPSHLRFLIVSTFLHGIVSRRFQSNRKCFLFVKIASQCLIAVYDRKYRDFFKLEGGAIAFESQCKHINTILSLRLTAKARKKLDFFNQKRVIEGLVRVSSDIDDDDLKLTEDEEDMLRETLRLLPQPSTESDEYMSDYEYYESFKPAEDSSSDSDEYVKKGKYFKKPSLVPAVDSSIDSDEYISESEYCETNKEDTYSRNRVCKCCELNCYDIAATYLAKLFLRRPK